MPLGEVIHAYALGPSVLTYQSLKIYCENANSSAKCVLVFVVEIAFKKGLKGKEKEKNVPAPWARVADLVVAQSWVDIHGVSRRCNH